MCFYVYIGQVPKLKLMMMMIIIIIIISSVLQLFACLLSSAIWCKRENLKSGYNKGGTGKFGDFQ